MKSIVNNWILRIAPVLAPLPTAYVIYGRLIVVLGWDVWIAFVAAAVIELVGFRSVGLAVEMYQFNRSLNATEKTLRAPLWLALSVVGMYSLAVLSLTILLEILPALSLWTPIAFVVMGLVGGGLLATLSSDQEEREKKRAEAKAKALKTRAEKKADKQGVQVAGASDKQADKLQVQVARKADKLHPQARKQADKQPVQDEALLAHWRDKPKDSDQQVADVFGKSRQAIQQRREKLIKSGAIAMTANGVEIVGISVSVKAEKPR